MDLVFWILWRSFYRTGLSIKINPTISNIYFVRAEGGCNTTGCVTTNIIVLPAPVPANFAKQTEIITVQTVGAISTLVFQEVQEQL